MDSHYSGRPQSGLEVVRNYFETLWTILVSPHKFFQKLQPTGGLTAPLTFAVVTHWLGAAFDFVWVSLAGGRFGTYYQKILDRFAEEEQIDFEERFSFLEKSRDYLQQWAEGVGGVILEPFQTLIVTLIYSGFVFLGARLLIGSQTGWDGRKVTFEAAVRAMSYASAPAILSVVPLVGGPVSTLYQMVLGVIGCYWIFRTTWMQAIIVGFFPSVVMGIMMLFIVMFFVLVMGLFAGGLAGF